MCGRVAAGDVAVDLVAVVVVDGDNNDGEKAVTLFHHTQQKHKTETSIVL